jgi:hypothetical protein
LHWVKPGIVHRRVGERSGVRFFFFTLEVAVVVGEGGLVSGLFLCAVSKKKVKISLLQAVEAHRVARG